MMSSLLVFMIKCCSSLMFVDVHGVSCHHAEFTALSLLMATQATLGTHDEHSEHTTTTNTYWLDDMLMCVVQSLRSQVGHFGWRLKSRALPLLPLAGIAKRGGPALACPDCGSTPRAVCSRCPGGAHPTLPRSCTCRPPRGRLVTCRGRRRAALAPCFRR